MGSTEGSETTAGAAPGQVGGQDGWTAVAALPRLGGARAALAKGETTRVVFVDARQGELARRAADRGIDQSLVEGDTLDAAVGLALEQLRELQTLRATYGRLRLVERAKGILMERHQIPERSAHELLHRQARNSNMRLSEVAEAVIETHLLLSDVVQPSTTPA